MRPDAAQRRQGELLRSGYAPHPVMGRADAVNRNADARESGGSGTRNALFADVKAAGLQVAPHAGSANRGDNLKPVLAQIGLAADQADVARAEFGNLLDQVERLGGVDFVPATAARA